MLYITHNNNDDDDDFFECKCEWKFSLHFSMLLLFIAAENNDDFVSHHTILYTIYCYNLCVREATFDHHSDISSILFIYIFRLFVIMSSSVIVSVHVETGNNEGKSTSVKILFCYCSLVQWGYNKISMKPKIIIYHAKVHVLQRLSQYNVEFLHLSIGKLFFLPFLILRLVKDFGWLFKNIQFSWNGRCYFNILTHLRILKI